MRQQLGQQVAKPVPLEESAEDPQARMSADVLCREADSIGFGSGLNLNVFRHPLVSGLGECFGHQSSLYEPFAAGNDHSNRIVTAKGINAGIPNASLCETISITHRTAQEGFSTGLSRAPGDTDSTKHCLGDFARVMRGIATGQNDFFFMTAKRAEELEIPKRCFVRAVGRMRDVQTEPFTAHDSQENLERLWRVFSDPRTLANLRLVGKSYGDGALKVETRSLQQLQLPDEVLVEAGLLNHARPEQAELQLLPVCDQFGW